MDHPLIVIGAGAGGLVIAYGMAKAGRKVLLIDKGTWGGDCTNFGCIPSKTLIHAAHEKLSGKEAFKRVHGVVDLVRSHEDPAALQKAGVETLEGTARFVDSHTLDVNGTRVRGKQIVIATGSSPNPPPPSCAGPYFTNETIFDLDDAPEKLHIMGGGPIGCELGQAFARLGTQVTLFQKREALLMREEPAAQAVILNALQRDGVSVHLGAQRPTNDGTPLLVAAGRSPNIAALALENAGIAHTPKGITIDAYGRTSQKHIWALGDCAGTPPFTHMAEFHARSILVSLLLPGPLKKRLNLKQAPPRCTYTDPEVASAGLLESQAQGPKFATYTLPLSQVDRALCTGQTEGFIKVVTKRWSSRILGATIVAPRAGEMLSELTLAMQRKISLRRLASLIHAYPTFSQGIRRTADLYLTETLLRKKR